MECQNIIQPIVITQLQSGNRLDKVLSNALPQYSRSKIKMWILNEKIKVDNIIVGIPKKKVFVGSIIKVSHDVCSCQLMQPQDIPLNIVYEDDFIIVIDKPCNFVVHPGIGNLSGTVYNALLHYYPCISSVPRAGIVQRLDKDTTGLMLIAKSVFVQNRLIHLFRSHKIIREYEAIVFGDLVSNGSIREPICRDVTNRTCMAVHPSGKLAITHFYIMENFFNYTRVRLQLETGRTHQIRVHMSHINHPIVGDQKYGKLNQILHIAEKCTRFKNNSVLYRSIVSFHRQALHACMLSFLHPVTELPMMLESPLPRDMVDLLNILRLNV